MSVVPIECFDCFSPAWDIFYKEYLSRQFWNGSIWTWANILPGKALIVVGVGWQRLHCKSHLETKKSVGSKQCDHIGLFLIDFGDKFRFKSSTNIFHLYPYLEKYYYFSTNWFCCFEQLCRKNGLLLIITYIRTL